MRARDLPILFGLVSGSWYLAAYWYAGYVNTPGAPMPPSIVVLLLFVGPAIGAVFNLVMVGAGHGHRSCLGVLLNVVAGGLALVYTCGLAVFFIGSLGS